MESILVRGYTTKNNSRKQGKLDFTSEKRLRDLGVTWTFKKRNIKGFS